MITRELVGWFIYQSVFFIWLIFGADVHKFCQNLGNSKAVPVTGLDSPWGFQEVEAPRFHDSRHMKVVKLSALRTGRLYSQENIPGTHFC
jgi:hypothetical protein